MSLATRCPACGTVFRVVSDQLKVSEGWVRCGRCAEVFNGAQRLFELDASAPGATPQPQPGATANALAVAAADDAGLTDSADAGHVALAVIALEVEPEIGATAEPAPDDAVAAPALREATAPAEPTLPAGRADSAGNDDVPQFMRRAERAARWQRPRRRGLLAGIAVLLATLLAGQLTLHYRDELAARWPAATAPLQAACAALGCRVQAPRHIAALNVDSSGLVRLPDSAHYRLTLVLQNKAPTAVLMPAVELALTDTQGHTVVRRVLSAAELGHSADRLAPRSELALQATLDLGDRRVAGYTVELFYP